MHRYERVQAEGFGDGYVITVVENDPAKATLVYESYVLVPSIEGFKAEPVIVQSNPGFKLRETDMETYHGRTLDFYWSLFVERLGSAAGFHQKKIRREKLGSMGLVAMALDAFCLPCLKQISGGTHSSELRHDIDNAIQSVEG